MCASTFGETGVAAAATIALRGAGDTMERESGERVYGSDVGARVGEPGMRGYAKFSAPARGQFGRGWMSD